MWLSEWMNEWMLKDSSWLQFKCFSTWSVEQPDLKCIALKDELRNLPAFQLAPRSWFLLVINTRLCHRVVSEWGRLRETKEGKLTNTMMNLGIQGKEKPGQRILSVFWSHLEAEMPWKYNTKQWLLRNRVPSETPGPASWEPDKPVSFTSGNGCSAHSYCLTAELFAFFKEWNNRDERGGRDSSEWDRAHQGRS